jgi:hypothetical protein
MNFGGPLRIASLESMLGIRPGMNVSIINPPPGFMEDLLPLPVGACLVDSSKLGLDMQVLFSTKKLEVLEKMTAMTRHMAVTGSLWVCFAPVSPDLGLPNEDFVRLAALELGLVDVKYTMFDTHWMGLQFKWKPSSPRLEKPQVRA